MDQAKGIVGAKRWLMTPIAKPSRVTSDKEEKSSRAAKISGNSRPGGHEGREKGNTQVKMKVEPTMLLKIKARRNGMLEEPTMLMIINDLFLESHDVDEN